MVASCPSCHARYKVADDKIKGRGARITCPKCSHKFTVYRDKVGEPAADIGFRDFRRLGLTWRAKRGVGIHYEFHDLDTLREHLASGRLDGASRLTYDNQTWTPIDSIADLEAWFGDVWKRGEKGQIQVATEREGGDREEDASDAPTTIVGRGSSLASEIPPRRLRRGHAPTRRLPYEPTRSGPPHGSRLGPRPARARERRHAGTRAGTPRPRRGGYGAVGQPGRPRPRIDRSAPAGPAGAHPQSAKAPAPRHPAHPRYLPPCPPRRRTRARRPR